MSIKGRRQWCLVSWTANMKIYIFLLVSLTWMGADGYPFFGDEYERTPVGDAIDKASLKILKEVYDSGDDKNVITSPLGVLLLLSLYSAGAGPRSQAEISSILGVTDFKKRSESYSNLSNRLAELDSSYFTLANKVYVADKYVLDDQFANTARAYRSEVDKLDFSKPQQAADIINAWSDEKTRGHIKTPVSPDILTPDTAAALFNVIFFQGHWNVPFEVNDTTDKDFHVNSTLTVKKPTMKLLQSLFYRESEVLGAKMIELPYKESGFRMVVVLPNKVDDLPAVLEKASQKGLLEDVFKLSNSKRDIELEMPKFEIKSKLDFNSILENVGISKIFTEPATGIVKGESVAVSKAFQEAFVKVDEEGVTASAFTEMIARPVGGYMPPKMHFRVDHPFLFLILHDDKILFVGTYNH